MKIQKQITLDVELNEKLLKEPNASSLINKLVKEHYEKVDNPFAGMSKEQLEVELKKIDILIEADEKVKKIDDEQRARVMASE